MMPQNVMHLQLGAAIKRRLAEIDDEVTVLYSEGYEVDADRLLDDRMKLIEEREALKNQLLA